MYWIHEIIARRGDKSINSHHMGYEENLLHILLYQLSYAQHQLYLILSISYTPGS